MNASGARCAILAVMRPSRTSILIALVALVLSFPGCGQNTVTAPPGPGPMPDFWLTDLNPASGTYGMQLSPRNYLGSISAWYFGHST